MGALDRESKVATLSLHSQFLEESSIGTFFQQISQQLLNLQILVYFTAICYKQISGSA